MTYWIGHLTRQVSVFPGTTVFGCCTTFKKFTQEFALVKFKHIHYYLPDCSSTVKLLYNYNTFCRYSGKTFRYYFMTRKGLWLCNCEGRPVCSTSGTVTTTRLQKKWIKKKIQNMHYKRHCKAQKGNKWLVPVSSLWSPHVLWLCVGVSPCTAVSSHIPKTAKSSWKLQNSIKTVHLWRLGRFLFILIWLHIAAFYTFV